MTEQIQKCRGQCGEELPLSPDFFYRANKNRKKNKLESICKCCRNERRAQQRDKLKR